VGDWRSYDDIADGYDRVWAPRFEIVARHIWTLMPPKPGDRILDIGVGTGIVARVATEIAGDSVMVVGCDRSAGMAHRAASQVAGLHVVVGDAGALPFRHESYDLATASFVLSHVPDVLQALREALRVLTRTGILAMSTWASTSDDYGPAWTGSLAEAISRAEVDRAFAEVAPSEAHLAQAGALEAAATQAGFSVVHSDAIDVRSDVTIEQFIQDRELSSAGRLGQQILGMDGWQRFRTAVAATLHARFGPAFRSERRALIVIARVSRGGSRPKRG
jgi:ubiquinone/menaquinone biosynthesis C-methylase UbiE